MKKKSFSLLISILLLSVFAVFCTAKEDITLDDTQLDKIPEATAADGEVHLFSADAALPGELEPLAIYIDTDGYVKHFLFRCPSDKDLSDDMSFKINGTNVNVTVKKAQNNNVYQPVSGNIKITDTADITFYNSDTSAAFDNVKLITITEGNANDWTLAPEGYRILQYTGSSSSITIPNYINGLPITAIGGDDDGEYYLNIVNNKTNTITDVYISEGILNICPCTFRGITTLTAANIPTTAEKIYQAAFDGCTKLSGTLELPEGLKMLSTAAFRNCSSLTGSLVIPSTLKDIGSGAFMGCSGFNGDLVIKDGVETIGTLAFGGQSPKAQQMKFTSLTLPSTLKSIGCYAFQWCTYMTNELILPEGLVTISDGAFDHMQNISNTSLIIPSTVTTIGGDYLVDQNTGYGGHVFYDMGKTSAFSAFYVADGNTHFAAEDGVLYTADMTRMIGYPRGKQDERFVLPDTVTQLDELAFSRVNALKTLVLPDAYVITDVPENVLNQDGNSLAVAIYVYTGIANVEVSADNPNYTSVDGILYSKDKTTLWYVPPMHEGTVEIAEECTTFEQGSFYAVKTNTAWTGVTIPAALATANANALEFLNACAAYKITAANNPTFTVNESGKLVQYITGDIDFSGTVDDTDAALLLRYVSGMSVLGSINPNVADVNNDTLIDIRDVISITKIAQ